MPRSPHVPKFVLLSVLLLAGCDRGSTHSPEPDGIELFRLPDVEGTELAVTTMTTGRTVLAFWATWCAPCQTELAELDSLYADLRSRGLLVYAISVDDSSTVSQVGTWVAREGYRFPVVLDMTQAILARYTDRKEVPFMVVLDGEGRVIEEHQGYKPGDIDALRGRLEAELTQ